MKCCPGQGRNVTPFFQAFEATMLSPSEIRLRHQHPYVWHTAKLVWTGIIVIFGVSDNPSHKSCDS